MLAEWFDNITQWLLGLIDSIGYLGIFIVTFLENVFTPIPSEAIIPSAGVLVAQGRFNVVGVIVAATLGSVVGAYVFYYLGYILGSDRVRNWIITYGKYLFVTEDDLDRAEKWFARYEDWAVLIGRVIPLVRSAISIPAGYVKMPFWKFTVLTTIGTAIWSTFLVYLGIIFGNNYEEFLVYLDKLDYVVVGAILLGIGYYLWVKLKNKRSTDNSETPQQQ